MTNVPSGSKRPWDGNVDTDTHKRPREDSKDWRDVHLRSPRGKPGTADRRDSVDRRRGEYRPRSRDRDHRRDYARDRRDDRSREHRYDRDRERERERDRDRDHRARRDDSRREDERRDEYQRRSPPGPTTLNGYLNGRASTPKAESEKEEGE